MKNINQLRGRMFFVLLLFTAVCLYLLYRIGYIAIAYGEEYGKHVINNQSMNIDYTISPLRGSIIDRNGELFAYSTKVYDIILDVAVLLNYNEEVWQSSVDKITELVDDVSKDYLLDIINTQPTNRYKVLKKGISLKEADVINKLIEDGELVGIWLDETTSRVYPNNHLASHVIGFEGGGSGHWGVEETYDKWLQGTPGRKLMFSGPKGMMVEDYIPPTHGHNIVLTLDESIQHFSEEVLYKYVEEYKPVNASVIIMDPHTGDILTMAAYPSFNLNATDEIIGYPEDIDIDSMPSNEKYTLLNNVWRNFNISDSYEPGSTYKPLIYAMALEEGLISTDHTFYCSGSKNIYGETIRCWKRTGHGEETLEEAIANSCNIAVMEVAELLKAEKYYKYQQQFGIGQKLHIDLIGEFSSAPLTYKLNDLGPVELATSSFGQGFNMTPIQLITANAAIINGGYLIQPHVVSQIVDQNGTIVKQYDRTVLKKVISEETSNLLRDMMESTVDYGTGESAHLEGYNIGGKTGTSQKGDREDDLYIYSFMSYTPVDDPKVMMLVVMDDPQKTEEVSKVPVKISKEIYEKILPYMDIYPNISTPN